jgi:hypothetical protein
MIDSFKENKLSDINNKNIIRIDFDPVENKKYYQYRFKLNNNNTISFKYYINNVISQIYTENIEYLGFYKVEFLEEVFKNNNKKINTDKFLIK